MNFTEKQSKKGEEAHFDIHGEIKDIKINGDRATGSVTKRDGTPETMHFVRRAGRWYMALDQ